MIVFLFTGIATFPLDKKSKYLCFDEIELLAGIIITVL